MSASPSKADIAGLKGLIAAKYSHRWGSVDHTRWESPRARVRAAWWARSASRAARWRSSPPPALSYGVDVDSTPLQRACVTGFRQWRSGDTRHFASSV